jgi:hypothetical protein
MDVIDSYLLLGLRLGRHVDGFVDAYYGPPEPAAQVEAEPVRDAAALAVDAERLAAALEADADLEPQRRLWLAAQVQGMHTVASRLAGAEMSYSDEVERTYGVRPTFTPEDQFAAAHEQLERLLPGDGALAERYQAWREGDPVPVEALPAVFDGICDELRSRTVAAVGLPPGEAIGVEIVEDEPWAAFNYYEGGLRSRIAVNVDLPVAAVFVGELAAHETYPGHHAEHAWKEHLHVRRRGLLEQSIILTGAPESLVSEGIAEIGGDALLGPGEVERIAAAVLAEHGVELDADLAHQVWTAVDGIEGVGVNVALLVHEQGASDEEAIEYLMRWALRSRLHAEKSLSFVQDPTWRAYVATYSDGRRACQAFVGGDLERFRRLLTEQLVPADLVA